MRKITRTNQMSVMLSDDEVEYREALSKELGVDASGVLRMALLELGRSRGLEFPLNKKKPRPKP